MYIPTRAHEMYLTYYVSAILMKAHWQGKELRLLKINRTCIDTQIKRCWHPARAQVFIRRPRGRFNSTHLRGFTSPNNYSRYHYANRGRQVITAQLDGGCHQIVIEFRTICEQNRQACHITGRPLGRLYNTELERAASRPQIIVIDKQSALSR